MFIFQIYTGLSYADMQLFSMDEVTESNGIYYIDGKRYKTGTSFYTPILPPALEVLKKYDYELPVMTNEKYDIYLHVIEHSEFMSKLSEREQKKYKGLCCYLKRKIKYPIITSNLFVMIYMSSELTMAIMNSGFFLYTTGILL